MEPKRIPLTLLILLLLTSQANSATFVVTKPDDTADGACTITDCSLREAVIAANLSPGPDEIGLPTGDYLLTLAGTNEDAAATGDLDLTGSVRIAGTGRGLVVIDGNRADRVFHVFPGVAVELAHLTVDKGLAPFTGANDEGGGAILNKGSLLLTDVLVRDSRVDGISLGGGLANQGQAYLLDSSVTGNSSYFAGGVHNSGSLAAFGAVLADNAATGAIGNGGALMNGGTAHLYGTSFTNNAARSGGALSNGGTLKLERCTLENNTANAGVGGGLYNTGVAEVANSTVSANSGLTGGGGVYSTNLLTVAASTITANVGDGVFAANFAAFSGTMVAGNSPANCTWVSAAVNEYGYNLDGANACQFIGVGSLRNTDPLLALIGDNGGPTRTHALAAGSPAVDAGKVGGPEDVEPYLTLKTDQRGFLRGQGGTRPDMGAFEYGGVAPAPADLELAFTPPAGRILAGAQFTYQIKVKNLGAATASDVRVLHYLPADVEAVTGTLTAGTTTGHYPPLYKVDALAPSGEALISVTARALKPGSYNLRAGVTSATGDLNNSNDLGLITVTAEEQLSDLAATIGAQPSTQVVGSDVTYTATVENLGPEAAEGVKLTFTDTPQYAQSPVSVIPSQGNCSIATVITCDLGQLANGASVTVTLVTRPLYASAITTTASATSISTDPAAGNSVASAQLTARDPAADFAVSAQASVTQAVTGVPFTITYTVENIGPDPAAPTLTVTPDSTLTVGTLTPSQGNATPQGAQVVFTPGELASGTSATLTVALTPTQPGPLSNAAEVQSGLADPDGANNSVATSLDARAAVKGSLRFQASSKTVAEEAGTVTLTVVRSGGSEAELTANFQTMGGSATEGSDYAPASGSLTWADGDAAAKAITVTIVDDALNEGAETFAVRLTGASLDATATVTIGASDAPPASGGGGGGGGCFLGSMGR